MWTPESNPSEMNCLLRLATRLTGLTDAATIGEQALDELRQCLSGTTWVLLQRREDGAYDVCSAGLLGVDNLAALTECACGSAELRVPAQALAAISFTQRPIFARWPNDAVQPEVVLGAFVDPGEAAPTLALLACAAQLCGHAVRTLRELSRLREESATDPLTGVLSRRAILARLDAERAWAVRSGKPLAVLFVDLDRFKAVNDRFGHAVGDQVLRNIAHTLRRVLRVNDAVGRVGGDEFLVLLPGAGPSSAARLAESLEALVAATEVLAGGTRLRPEVSIGIASGDQEAVELLATADHAMLARKRARAEPGRERAVA